MFVPIRFWAGPGAFVIQPIRFPRNFFLALDLFLVAVHNARLVHVWSCLLQGHASNQCCGFWGLDFENGEQIASQNV